MKKLLFTTAAVLLTVAAFAQGTVTFANASSTPGWANPTADRYAHWLNATGFNPALTDGGLVNSNQVPGLTSLRAALYYAASTDFDPNFVGYVAASGGAASFKTSVSATAGSWFGHNDTLDTIPNGTTANLVVFVWDTSVSADPLSPAAQTGLYGHSAVFQYTPPTNPLALPSDFLMAGLTGFGVGFTVPEPGAFTLVSLGAAALLIFRRRK